MIALRAIAPADNEAVATVIRTVLLEHDVPKVGTAYADASLDCMYETYTLPRSSYFVVEQNGRVVGGAGIAPLAQENETYCELQKMYFLPEARGLGAGSAMMQKCLTYAQQQGYTHCYLETLPNMLEAQKLYRKVGFTYLDAPMGCTGHTSCSVWMLKQLD